MNGQDENSRFYELFVRMASATEILDQKIDNPLVESLLNEIAAMHRLSKGVTHFYRTPADELRGIGETMISYDTGTEGRPVHTVRVVSRLMSIATMTVYMAPDEPPLTEDELFRVDLTMRTALNFISRNRLQVIAEELAFYDDTGYRNIRSYYNYLSWRGEPGGLNGAAAVCYNLRHFSVVNNELGIKTGDKVLRAHYDLVSDIVGKSGIVSRLGGDTFVCLCDTGTLPGLLKFLDDGEVYYDNSGNKVNLSASVGVYVLPENFVFRDPGQIMNRMMMAYNISKRSGDSRTIFYNEKIASAREHAKRIQQQFPEALKNGEFKVFFQPKVNTYTGQLSGGEALCRWVRDGRIVPPMDFIPILEETSDICKLDFYMLDQVCRSIRRWLDEGRRAVRISVNLSRRHMVNKRLLETIIEIIDRNKVPHEYIEIELTETTTDVEFKDLQRVVCGLQEQNIYTSVDDFGMGYSSLNLIRVIPWNVLKVDRSFLPLDDEDSTSIRSIMFKHVVAMTKEMGLECIVEGVETPAQLAVLKENSCELAQGFLFDRPLPMEDFEKRLDMQWYHVE